MEPSTNPKSFSRLVNLLQECKTGDETSLSAVIERIIPTIKRRSLIVLITDGYDDIEALGNCLSRLRHGRHEVILFQVIAPEEEEFPFNRPTRFHNLERENHRLLVDPNRLRKTYLEQYAKFSAELVRMCGGIGVDHQKLVTTQPYEKALGAFLDSRARQKKKR